MARQLNIRSNEAYGIAHRLAERRGETVTAVVIDALRKAQGEDAIEREVNSRQAAKTFRILMELSERSAEAARSGATSDHSDFYDDRGLLK